MRIYQNFDQHNTMLCGLGMNFLSHANTHTAKHRMQKFQNVPNPLGKISLIRHFFSFPRHSALIPNKTATRLSHSILCFCGIESGGIIFISSYVFLFDPLFSATLCFGCVGLTAIIVTFRGQGENYSK